MGALKDVYEVAKKANLPTEVARLRGKLEQLEQEHAQEVQRLKKLIKGLEALVKQLSPPISSEKAPPVAPGERVDKDDLPLDAQGWSVASDCQNTFWQIQLRAEQRINLCEDKIMASDTAHGGFRPCIVGNSSGGGRQEQTPSSRLEQRPYVLLIHNHQRGRSGAAQPPEA